MKALTLAVCATIAAVGCSTEPAATVAREHQMSAEGVGDRHSDLPSAPAPSPDPTTTTTETPAPTVATTTTTEPEPVATTAPRRSSTTAPYVEQAAVTGACGGSLPPCWVLRQESGGNIRAVNATGCGGRGCYGKWQADPLTSRAQGYPLTMDQYDEATQDEFARGVWAGGSGCAAWAAC